jgi:hypothetical protein
MFAAEPSGFEAWWTEFLNIAYPTIQMLFWLVMIGAAIYAVVLFRRWVNAQTGTSRAATEEPETVSVEEFVE